jgi:hypothetical protein
VVVDAIPGIAGIPGIPGIPFVVVDIDAFCPPIILILRRPPFIVVVIAGPGTMPGMPGIPFVVVVRGAPVVVDIPGSIVALLIIFIVLI